MRLRLAVLFLLAAVHAVSAGPEAVFVEISDQHSAYRRAAQFVGAIDEVKAAHPGVPLAVLIDGDLFEAGNVVAARSAGVVDFAMIRALARRAPTIVNLGNHDAEFFSLPDAVQRLRDAGAIVIGDLAAVSSGELVAPASIRLPLGDQTAVVAGIGTNLLAQYPAAVRTAVSVPNPLEWAQTHWPTLFGRAPLRIVLSHAGLRADRDLLPLVPDGTLFIGAHDHLRFVHQTGRSVYLQSGAWNTCFAVITLERDAAGVAHWTVEQRALADSDAADPELAAVIAATEAKWLRPADVAVVGRLPAPLPREAAARWVTHAVRVAAGADAAFIGNTTFGDGLPAGPVRRIDLDGCVRFDGTICVADVDGTQLQQWLDAANPEPGTPFAQRRGEFLFADGPARIDPAARYRIATTDWGMRNRGRYFGTEALRFTELPELHLKAIVAKALNPP